MKVIFRDEALAELFEYGKTKDRKYKNLCKKPKLTNGYQRVVGIMQGVPDVQSLSSFSFLHYEKLRHQKEQRSSIRIVNGEIERLIFTETADGIEVELIEIDSTHYGNKK